MTFFIVVHEVKLYCEADLSICDEYTAQHNHPLHRYTTALISQIGEW
jgi:hypothetical protein